MIENSQDAEQISNGNENGFSADPRKVNLQHLRLPVDHGGKIFRSSHRSCSLNEGGLKISKNSQKNTCARVSFLIKLKAWPVKKETGVLL